MHTASSPSHPGHDRYEELCALAGIGELSSSEFEEFRAHLAECGDCRQLYAEFRRVAGKDLGLVASFKESDSAGGAEDAALDENAFLARLLEKASEKASQQKPQDPAPIVPERVAPERQRIRERFRAFAVWLRRPALSYGSFALILSVLAALGAYRLREAQLRPALNDLSSTAADWKNRASATEAQRKSTSEQLNQSQAERDLLAKSLDEAQKQYADLRNQQKLLEIELTAERARADLQTKEVETARHGIQEKDKQIADLENRIQLAVQRTDDQRRIAEDLRARMEYLRSQGAQQAVQVQAATAPEAQGFGDAETKALFGARDLHIVDVYDVDAKGNARRSYGRVYYVEKKLLIFYAFDLQDKKRNRAAAGFQAWGYRQPSDTQPESLGLFDLDDASANRWVLRVNNPPILERIDAVFVTLEPPNGSPSPRGRRLLYANLAGPANHP